MTQAALCRLHCYSIAHVPAGCLTRTIGIATNRGRFGSGADTFMIDVLHEFGQACNDEVAITVRKSRNSAKIRTLEHFTNFCIRKFRTFGTMVAVPYRKYLLSLRFRLACARSLVVFQSGLPEDVPVAASIIS